MAFSAKNYAIQPCPMRELLVFGDDRDGMSLEHFIGRGFFLDNLEIHANNLIEDDEIIILLGLHEGSFVTAPLLAYGLELLFKKNRFSMIRLRMQEEVIGKKLSIECFGLWTLRSIAVGGILLGKELYKNYYVLEPGDSFDIKKHHHSIDRMKEALRKEGYFQATIDAKINYDEHTKSVDVHIGISARSQFSIGTIQVVCKDKQVHLDGEPLEKKIKLILNQILPKGRYKWGSINKAVHHLKKYLAKKGFNSVKIELEESINKELKRVNLTFLLDLSIKREFIFFGNQFFSRDQLQEIVAGFGSAISIVPASMIVQELIQAYHAKGFWHASIEIKEENSSNFVLINEGNRAIITSVNLKGIADDRHTQAVHFFKRLLKHKYFDALLLKQAVESLVTWYINAGFWHMQVVNQEYSSQGENLYSLQLTVDEGVCSSLVGLEVVDYPALQEEGPLGIFTKELAHTGKIPLQMACLQEQKRWLLDYFHNRGYVEADVQSELTGDPDALTLVWRINPGPIAYFGKTVIQGPIEIPYSYILRELKYQPGTIWDTKKLQESQISLHDLGIFETVHMHPDRTGVYHEDGQERPVIVRVSKQDPFELRIRTGFGLQQVGKNFALGRGITYKLGATFMCKNPFNKADQLLFDADFTRSHESVQCEYRRPWMFNQPIKGIIKGYSVTYDQPGFVGAKNNLYRIKRQGFLMGLNRYKKQVELTCNAGVEWLQTCVSPEKMKMGYIIGKAIDFNPLLFAKKIPYFLIEPTVVIDYVDNRMCPTRGTFTLLSCRSMTPLNHRFDKAYFVRLQVDQSFFIPCAKRFVWGFRIRCGHIIHKNFSAIMPVERFYLGGANSVRSYDTDLCPPLKVFLDEQGEEQIAPRGGTTMINANIELRFAWNRLLELALFQDFGYLSGAPHNWFDPDSWVAGSGFGIRYNTPLGPLRFDIGWKWRTNRIIERPFAWFLRLGHAF